MKNTVAIAKCNSYDEEEVYQAIKKLLKCIAFSFPKGSKVLLKPNILIPHKPEQATTTHPSIIAALCRILSESNCKVFLGDSDGSGTIHQGLLKSGIADAAKKYHATIVIFEKEKKVTIKNKNNIILKEFYLPQIVRDVDIIVNLPKLKTHALTKFTGAVKNMFGTIPGMTKAAYHKMAPSEEKFSNLLLDIYQNVTPHLTIMDGIIGMEGLGPSQGKPKQTNVLLASTDGIALDDAASSLIGFKKDEILTIKYAYERKISSKDFTICDEHGSCSSDILKRFAVHYKKPPQIPPILRYLGQAVYAQFLPYPVCEKKYCTKCKVCMNHCPVKAISMNPYPNINKEKCIRCFCCVELCSFKAMALHQTKIKLVLDSILHGMKKQKSVS